MSAGMILAQPCLAQGVDAPSEFRPAAFAGVTLGLPIGGPTRTEPALRLQLTTDHGSPQRRNASRHARPAGVEIGLVREKPALFVNGRQASPADGQLGLGGSGGQTALIVGGVVLAAVVIGLAAGGAGPGDTCPTINGSRDHCINP